MWTIKASQRIRSAGAHIPRERENNGRTFFLLTQFSITRRSDGWHDESELCPVHAWSPFDQRFKRITFPIIRGHRFAINSERYMYVCTFDKRGIVDRRPYARVPSCAGIDRFRGSLFLKVFFKIYVKGIAAECSE